MERLTRKYVGGGAYVPIDTVNRVNEEECVGLPITKLARYEEAEEQGLLLRLPCKVGDTIFEINYKSLKEYKVTGFSYGRLMGQDEEDVMSKNEILIHICNQNKDITGYFVASEIGEDIFLTREEAEQKLKEMEVENETSRK